ncbi:MAG: carboxypeptidase regulatory-like domain-containing protein [Verrucomicrobia bacterium]|nr:carboxypeptidase regulatory-like domain-containing protein [Verrucomicrobiota bacterium]
MKKLLLLTLILPAAAFAAEVLKLDAKNWSAVPPGKEMDAIYGDWLLRNDKVVAVVAGTLSNRNINLTFRKGQGALIDFTLRDAPNDQLTGFLPLYGATNTVASIAAVTPKGAEVTLRVTRPATADMPVEVAHDYRLHDGDQHLTVFSRVKNTAASNISFRVADKLRADSTFLISRAGTNNLATAYDKWFGAAYGVTAVSPAQFWCDGKGSNSMSGTVLEWRGLAGPKSVSTATVSLAAGQELTLERRVIAGRHEIEVQDVARRLRGEPSAQLALTLTSSNCVAGIDIAALAGTNVVGYAQTDARGRATLGLAPGDYKLRFASIGRDDYEGKVTVTTNAVEEVPIPPAARIEFNITDAASNAIPCKVQFIGVGDTATPNLGPQQRAWGCKNLYFSPNGKFSQEVPPGSYYLLVTRGPEYDAVWRTITIRPKETASIRAVLRRVLDSRGWISADFHNHSTDSGDNTTEAESRITCLAAEGVEFAACTEHNRIMTYRQRLKTLGLDKMLATSDGIELTGDLLFLNHENAFPLKWKPNRQNGGGPDIDSDPEVQIARLARWDDNSRKLVQQNHPDMGWLFFDKDGDGVPDEGYANKKFMNVIEIWNGRALVAFGAEPMIEVVRSGKTTRANNRFYNWMQLFNQGFRIWGVANTDAHYCFHDSGTIRNYVKSPTDDPAKVKEMDVVREANSGHILVTNGPFLEAAIGKAGPGDPLTLKGGKDTLHIRVQCANWLDVDRVGVFINGRLDPKLTWTREKNPEAFRDGVVKFERDVPLQLKGDAHLIVAAQGDNFSTAPVMGLNGDRPVAVTNPILVDTDGDGKVTPNKDWLESGGPPVKKQAGY